VACSLCVSCEWVGHVEQGSVTCYFQVVRDSLERATVSLAANRHDIAEPGTGDFATIDLLVNLAQKHG